MCSTHHVLLKTIGRADPAQPKMRRPNEICIKHHEKLNDLLSVPRGLRPARHCGPVYGYRGPWRAGYIVLSVYTHSRLITRMVYIRSAENTYYNNRVTVCAQFIIKDIIYLYTFDIINISIYRYLIRGSDQIIRYYTITHSSLYCRHIMRI